MSIMAMQRWLLVAAALACLAATNVQAAEPSYDIAARALLGEAEKLIEFELPQEAKQEALLILDRLQQDYPDAQVIRWAAFRRAQCLMFLDRYDEAIAVGRSIVSQYPGTVLAAWAETVVGESLVQKGEVAAGISELLKVDTMLPDRHDLGPLNTARGVLGRICTANLKDTADPLEAMDTLGLDRSDVRAKAKVLAIVAVYRMRQDRLDLANVILDQIAWECPSETGELEWASTEVARMASARTDEHGVKAAEILSRMSSVPHPGDQEAAMAHLALARYYKRHGNPSQAAAVLQDAALNCSGTRSDDAVLYELGNMLYRQGQDSQASAVLKRLVDDMPLSGYAGPALYSVGMHSGSDPAGAVQALTALAEGKYDRRWRGLALWRLGSLLKAQDKSRAKDYLSRARKVFEDCLSEQKGDVVGNWREMLQTRIDLIGSEIQAVDGTTEVAP